MTATVAWHGSPHRFDAFSLHAIGSGEGSQSYGWGMYFAGSVEVADYYRRQLSVSKALYQACFDADGSPDRLMQVVSHLDSGADDDSIIDGLSVLGLGPDEAWRLLADGHALYRRFSAEQGIIYSVALPEVDRFLRWDQPLGLQPWPVRQALQAAGIQVAEGRHEAELAALKRFCEVHDTPLVVALTDLGTQRLTALHQGRALYQHLMDTEGSPRAASQWLSALGIAGICYLDGFSREGG